MLVYIYWRTYFDDLLPRGADGIIVVLENTCNQTYTYEVNGIHSTWLGRGDHHDPKYDFLEVSTSINSVLLGEGEGEEDSTRYDSGFEDDTESDILYYDCLYNIRVYPSEAFENRYRSNKPLTQASILAALFFFTSTVFLFYSYVVERRQKLVLKYALQSGKLVSSLFPEDVRERLYKEQELKKKEKEQSLKKNSMTLVTNDEETETDNTAIASLHSETTGTLECVDNSIIDAAGSTVMTSDTGSHIYSFLRRHPRFYEVVSQTNAS